MTVLVISTPDDVHAQAVCAELTRRGVRSVIYDMATAVTTTLHATVGPEPLRARVGSVDLDDVRTVWLRRAAVVRVQPGPAAAFVARETLTCLMSLAASLADRRWVNPLGAALRTDGGAGKLSQLEVARAVGLAIPRTLATNSPDEARAFVASCSGGAVYKPFEAPHLEDKRVIFCRAVDGTHDFAQVAVAPCLFQERVAKRVDVRAIVVGDRVLAAEIHSQEHPDSAVDFRRRYALGTTRYGVHLLPPAVEAQVHEVHRRLGLVFGACDLIHAPDGRYVWLETNQMGQWLWLEEQVGLRLVEAVADLLMA